MSFAKDPTPTNYMCSFHPDLALSYTDVCKAYRPGSLLGKELNEEALAKGLAAVKWPAVGPSLAEKADAVSFGVTAVEVETDNPDRAVVSEASAKGRSANALWDGLTPSTRRLLILSHCQRRKPPLRLPLPVRRKGKGKSPRRRLLQSKMSPVLTD